MKKVIVFLLAVIITSTGTSLANFISPSNISGTEDEKLNPKKGTDVVIVFDRSESMDRIKFEQSKFELQKLVDGILKANEKNQVGLVSFAGKDEIVIVNYLSRNYQDISNKLEGLDIGYGSFIQRGLREADRILALGENENKYIILISSGQPTYSYAEVIGFDDTDVKLSGNSYKNLSWKGIPHIAGINYFTELVVGNGKDYNVNFRHSVTRSFDHRILGHIYYTKFFTVDTLNGKKLNNGDGTLIEAEKIKNKGIEIYSISVNTDNNVIAQELLKSIATNKNNYFNVKNIVNVNLNVKQQP